MTPQERLDHLLAIAPFPSNRGRITHTWVAENIGLETADGIHAAINAQSPPAAARYATGNGIDTAADWWKARVEAAASNAAIALHLETLRDFESIYQTGWQAEGYVAEPTLESVTLEINKQTMEDSAVNALQTYREALAAWNGVDPAPVLGGA